MAEFAHLPHYTFREYLRLEAEANTRHEHLDGAIYAMAGGTPEYAARAANAIGALRSQLRSQPQQPGRVYTADLRIRVAISGLTTYPDCSVICGPLERDPDDENTITNPCLVVEVLSPSTASYDRGTKLAAFKRLASMREILLVAHDEVKCEHWHRADDGPWTCEVAGRGETIALGSIVAQLAVDEIYEGTLDALGSFSA